MKDNAFWSSEATVDEILSSNDREYLIDTFLWDYDDYKEEDEESVYDRSIEDLRELAYNQYVGSDALAFDYEDLVTNLIPEFEKQANTTYPYLWVVGNYQKWDGGHEAFGFYEDIEEGILDICYPDYESTSSLCVDENNNVYFTETNHDTPMGGTLMYLYYFDDTMIDEATEIALELDGYQSDDEYFEDYGYYCDWEYYKDTIEWVSKAIDKGVLKHFKY